MDRKKKTKVERQFYRSNSSFPECSFTIKKKKKKNYDQLKYSCTRLPRGLRRKLTSYMKNHGTSRVRVHSLKSTLVLTRHRYIDDVFLPKNFAKV